jgi:hypothetical protein
VLRTFQEAAAPNADLDVRNLLILGTKPREASGSSNMAVLADAFVSSATHDYALAPGAAPIDAGVAIPSVATDRAGVTRPQGRYVDVGAYEWRAP